MIQSIERGREESGKTAIADKIVDRLHDLEKTVDHNLGRWAWELLQNAKDSIAEDDNRTLSIQIELNQDKIQFNHNGTHFTQWDIIGLINQISSKKVKEGEQTKKIGRFGTGFLTTHLLSRVIEIKGVLRTEDKNLYQFNFLLDRQGDNRDRLLPRIDKSWNEFDESLTKLDRDFNENQFNTSFCYHLETDRQRNIAKRGMKEFSDLIPFVLAFVPKITKVEIIDRTNGDTTCFTSSQQSKDSPIVHILKTENGGQIDVFILYASSDRVGIATELEKTEKGYLIKEIKDIPKLFCDFPLIGTENFHFPMVVNSFFFNPQTERDGVWLKGKDDKEVEENQRILQDAVELYKQLVSQIAGNGFFNLYNLVETKIPSTDNKYFDEKWYEDCIQKPLREFIFDVAIVELETDENIKKSINELYFPGKSLTEEIREKIWHFIFDLSSRSVCKKSHLHSWCSLSWNDWRTINYKELVNEVTGRKDISRLSQDLGKSEIDTFEWLNSFIKFILEDSNDHSLFENSLIVPNKNGNFRKRKELYKDEIEDEYLIEILRLLGEDWRDSLRHDLVEFEDNLTKTKENIAAIITEKLKKHDSADNTVKAINILCEWFEKNPKLGADIFPYWYSKRAELFMNNIQDKESLYKIMRTCKDLSKLAELTELIKDNNNIVEAVRKAEDMENAKMPITKEVLLDLGVTSLEELKQTLEDKNIAEQFIHTPTPSFQMFIYVQELIKRAKKNVLEHLKTLEAYDCSNWEELAATVIGGIRKKDLDVSIVVRPSDSGKVIIYNSSEKDILEDDSSAELWIDDGVQKPRILTLGKILKITGISRIPV